MKNIPDNQRHWRDFGTGALGAMGCHVMDGAFWALKLADATIFTIEAETDQTNSRVLPPWLLIARGHNDLFGG